MRDLRTLLVEIHPPNLASAGLEVALSDLLSPLEAAGIATELHVAPASPATATRATSSSTGSRARPCATCRRTPDADRVRVDVTRAGPGITRLVVTDDGRGFAPADRERREAEGHVGLSLLAGLVERAGGRLAVRSEPGQGTTVELEVPAG